MESSFAWASDRESGPISQCDISLIWLELGVALGAVSLRRWEEPRHAAGVSWRVRLINPVPAFNKPFTVLIPFIHRVFNEVPGWQLPHAASKRITGQRQLGRFCREDPCRPPSARFSSLGRLEITDHREKKKERLWRAELSPTSLSMPV